MPKKQKSKEKKAVPKGHWIITAPKPTRNPINKRYISEKKLLHFLRKNPGCIVSWKKGAPLKDHP